MTYIQSPVLLFRQTTDVTVTNTTTDTSSIGAGIGDRTLAANFWVAGRTVRIKGGGIYTTPVSSNITTKVKFGSTTLVSKNTNALLNSQTNMAWTFEVTIACQSVTSGTGSFVITGTLLFDTGGTSPAGDFVSTLAVKASADVTTAQLLDVTNAWDAASATRSVTTHTATIERLG